MEDPKVKGEFEKMSLSREMRRKDKTMTTKTNKTNEKNVKIGEADRMKGMLWGLVVGDCLGSPIQFSSKDGHPWITEMVECPVFRLPPGYWTDDSSMAMCVMDSYIRKEGYDLKDIGATFCKWLKTGYLSSVEGRSFDVGGTTYASCAGLAKGSLVNGVEDSQGNGSIMRFAPSYLIARKLGRAEVMHEVSDLTHASKRVREVVDRFAGILDEHMTGKRTSAKSAYNTREEVNNSGWAVSTLEAALWAFETTDNFEDGMIAAVNLAGDADTIGAVFGQLAGAMYGMSAIPRRWIEVVKDWEKVDAMIDSFVKLVEQGDAELSAVSNEEMPVKRGPGRPRKNPAGVRAKKDPKVWRKNCGYARWGAEGPVEARSQISAPKSLVEKFRATFEETERRAAISAAIEYVVKRREKGLQLDGGDERSSDEAVLLFHKHLKEHKGGTISKPRIGIHRTNILEIVESYLDGTTLLKTRENGTIAVEESFEEAMRIWGDR